MNEKEILARILGCGIADLDVITSIDDGVMSEALERVINEEDRPVNFPALYVTAVEVACEKLGLEMSRAFVDANYSVARVYVPEEYVEKFEKLGFVAFPKGDDW